MWPEVFEITMRAFDKHGQAYPWAGQPFFPVFMGDSLTNGTTSSITALTNTCAYLIASGGQSYSLGLGPGQWGVLATPSIKLNALELDAQKHIDGLYAVLGIPILLVFYAYRNDKGGASFVARVKSFIAARRAASPVPIKVVLHTATDYSEDGIVDDATRNAYNSQWDTEYANTTTGLDGYCRIHNSPHLGADGSWSTFPTYLHTDHLHWSDLGAAEVATYLGPVVQSIYGGASGLVVSSI